MKLKKAMKLYPIEKKRERSFDNFYLGYKFIFISSVDDTTWMCADGPSHVSESAAVAWLVEGAKKLSPMERAMRKYPINKSDNGDNGYDYDLGDRGVYLSRIINPGKWMNDRPGDYTTYTEKEAVAYLLEGYKADEPKPVKVILEHVDVEKNGQEKTIDTTAVLGFWPKQAQTVLDTIWNAGYRPTKEAK
jgi:hypothetical protein